VSLPFLQRIRAHTGRQIDKWAHYGPIYDRHLDPLWTTAKRILEIGVDHGGSLQLWAHAFPSAQIVGLDINPDCKRFEEDGFSIVIGDQTDTALLATLGEFDIVIDDGSHDPAHQGITFTALYPKTKSVYLIEDCHRYGPALVTTEPSLVYNYPWVVVVERPERIIRGDPSRDLRPDEQEARDKYGVRPLR
jgi:hypothetical protein